MTTTVTAAPAAAGAKPAASPAASAAAAKPSAAAAAGTLADNDWTVVSPVKVSGFDSLVSAVIRVRNDSDHTKSSFFTITYVGAGGEVLATFSGAANDVDAGKTATVTMLTSDKIKAAPKGTVEFQAQG